MCATVIVSMWVERTNACRTELVSICHSAYSYTKGRKVKFHIFLNEFI